MKYTIPFLISIFLFCRFSGSAQHMFDYSDIKSGKFSQKTVSGLKSMNDGEHYTILQDNRIEKYAYKTGELVTVIFDADELSFDFKVEGYEFNNDESKILIYSNKSPIYRHSFTAEYYVYHLGSKELKKLSEKDKIRDVSFLPTYDKMIYIYENNIYLVDINSGTETIITEDGHFNNIINGHTDWVYEEEFGFTRAYEISPDGKYLAFLRFDESEVMEYTIPGYGEDGELYPKPFTYKYPVAGEKNSIVTLHLYDFHTSETTIIDTGSETDQYIPRIGWTPSGKLFFYRTNRKQNHFQLLIVDNNEVRIIYEEKDRRYIERQDKETITFLPKGDRFVVKNETNGYMHLYLYSIQKGVTDTLTRGNWEVTQFLGVDNDRAYYLSNEGSPLRQNLYSVRLNGKGKTRLTTDEGFYRINPSTGFKYFISYFSNTSTPNLVRLHTESGKIIRTLEDNAELKKTATDLRIPKKEFFRFTTERGTVLNGYIVKPNNFDENKKYPVLMSQYSGPGSQQVLDRWTLDWTDVLVQEGYIVVCVDGRGTGGRGSEFKKFTYGNLGGPETEDQISAAKYIATQTYVDIERIGIYGWSYGGFMALNCILKGADIFKTAIAVAPVTSWRYYDTIYTEIYNGLPSENPAGYDNNSPVNFAENLKGKLLIIHGTADDNVHIQNTYSMTSALVKEGKKFDMIIYPGDNHSMVPGGRHHVMESMIEYISNNL